MTLWCRWQHKIRADQFPLQNTFPRREARMATIGTRLSISSFLCTIRYIGPVEGTTGIWWGVEWDDPSRGKHSGTHDGDHQYFSTRYSLPASKNPLKYGGRDH